jgi:hypothetical protein
MKSELCALGHLNVQGADLRQTLKNFIAKSSRSTLRNAAKHATFALIVAAAMRSKFASCPHANGRIG